MYNKEAAKLTMSAVKLELPEVHSSVTVYPRYCTELKAS
jgi:hypothetical protein